MNSVSIPRRPPARASSAMRATSSWPASVGAVVAFTAAHHARAAAAAHARARNAHRAYTDPVGRISRVIFSSKAEYGVRLMVELGRQTPERPTSLKAIAEAERLPLAYLEQVVARLKRAGLVMSARGAHGGYWLARPAEEITMDEVVQALEGAIAPMECFLS